MASPASAATWSSYFSEETDPNYAWCGTGDEAVSGVRCSGSYCDNVSIRCQPLPFNLEVSFYHWSQPFSEEGSNIGTTVSHPHPNRYYTDLLTQNMHVCNANGEAGVVTGFQCDSGSYCDNIQLECATPGAWVGDTFEPARFTACSWSDYYSEEDPWFAYGATSNFWITGVECANSYCDDKRYHICTMAPPANSCDQSCGGPSYDSSCWCDELCTTYGDCCGDYEDVC